MSLPGRQKISAMSKSLKVLSLNVLGLRPGKHSKFVEWILNGKFDLILLQETWHMQRDLVSTHPTTFLNSPISQDQSINQGHFKNGLLVMGNPKCRHLFSSKLSSEFVLSFVYDGIHLSMGYFPPTTLTDESLYDVLESSPSRPTVLLGDFNYRLGAVNNDRVVDRPNRRRIVEAWASKNDLVWCKPVTEDLSSRTDHVYSNPILCHTRVEVHDIRREVHSDHLALFVEITKSARAFEARGDFVDSNQKTFRLRTNLLKDQDYANCLRDYFDAYATSLKIKHRLTSLIRRTGDLSAQQMDFNALRKLLDKEYALITRCVWEASRDVLGTYDVRKARLQPDRILDQINDCVDTVGAITLFKRSQRVNQTRLAFDEEQYSNAVDEAYQQFEKVWSGSDDAVSETPTPHIDSSLHFDDLMVDSAVKKYPLQKACGADFLNPPLLKELWLCSFREIIILLFNICLKFGITPSAWNEAISTLIPKDVGAPSVSSSRPISVTPLLRRIFESCLLQWIHRHHPSFLKLHSTQAGARKGYSAMTHVVVADEILNRNQRCVALLDVSKAFDSVPHWRLLEALKAKGFSPSMMNIVYSLFISNVTTRLSVNGVSSVPLGIKQGVLQGSPLAPILFEIFIDPLAGLLDQHRRSTALPCALLYADDIILFGKDVDHMQELLVVAGSWMTEHGMRFNVNKSHLLKHSVLGPVSQLSLCETTMSIVEESKYLGVPITAGGVAWDKLLRNQISKMKSTIRYLSVVGSRWMQGIRLIIYRTFVQPLFDYCGPATHWFLKLRPPVNKEIVKLFKELEAEYMKFIFDIPNSDAIAVLRSMSQLLPPTIRLEQLAIGVFSHVQSLDSDHPWRQLARSITPVGGSLVSSNSVLHRMNTEMPEVTKWRSERRSGPGRPLTLKDWLKKWQVELLSSAKQRLVNYVADTCRDKPWKPDKCLFHPDNKVRRWAIAWRRNRLFSTRQCFVPDCGQVFHRGHVTRCEYFGMLPDHLRDESLLGEALDLQHTVADYWMDEYESEYQGFVCWIDMLLNKQRYDDFKALCEWLLSKFEPLTSN